MISSGLLHMEKSDKDYIYYSCEHEWFDGFAKVKYEKNESFLDACDKGSVSVKVWQGLVNRK